MQSHLNPYSASVPFSIWPLQTAPCKRVPVCEVYLMRKTMLSGLSLWLPFILYWLWSVKLTLSTPLYRKSAENLMTGEGGRKFLTRFLLWTLWQKRQARNSWGANSAVSGVLGRSVYREPPPLHTLRVPVALQWHGGNQVSVELGCEPMFIGSTLLHFPMSPWLPINPPLGNLHVNSHRRWMEDVN